MSTSADRGPGCRDRLAITSSFATILALVVAVLGVTRAVLDWKVPVRQSGRDLLCTQFADNDADLTTSVAALKSPLQADTPEAPAAVVFPTDISMPPPTTARPTLTTAPQSESVADAAHLTPTVAAMPAADSPAASTTPIPPAATEAPTTPTEAVPDPTATPMPATAVVAPTVTSLPPTAVAQVEAPIVEDAPATVDASLAAAAAAPADAATAPPTATAAAMGSQGIVSATTQHPIPAPTLLRPEAGAKLTGKINFMWQWDGEPLPEGFAFDLLIWSDAEHQQHGGTKANGVMAPGRSLEGVVDLDYVKNIAEQGEGLYYWTVVVVREEPYERLGAWGESRSFAYYRLESPAESPTKSP